MFEVIISLVKTGRVERLAFATREEAERHVARREETYLTGRGAAKRSLRDLRMEIHYRPAAAPVLAGMRLAA
jgi:hypothetical protein